MGLTGNIAAGTSTVSNVFARKGATIIDADVLAREAVAPGSAGLDAVLARWGDKVRAHDGSLDRTLLRGIVFADAAEREALNAIVHPRVEELREAAVADALARGDRIVICDIPLLYEKDMAGRFNAVVLVDAPRALRLQRLVRERGLPTAEAEAMIDAQMTSDSKRKRADYVIDNVGSHAELEQRTADVWRSIIRDADRMPAS
ncbi:MAG TPA: dephospho-CoA kinase [Gemmatimonadaceae bacterium]